MPNSALGDRNPPSEQLIPNSKIRPHQSIKNKIKKPEKYREQAQYSQAQSLLNNFRVMAANSGNRLEFITRSKKMLAERKRNDKGLLPSINEF